MSESKSYNRIVFLTTLSVYLGLVLVGAASPVLAQAALTQRFEIQNEIEAEDDLDKNPDDGICSDLERHAEDALKPFYLNNSALETVLGIVDNTIYNFLKPEKTTFTINRNKSGVNEDEVLRKLFSDFEATNFSFGFDESEINSFFKISYNSQDKAQKVALAFNSSLNYWQCESQTEFDKIPTKLYSNTRINAENNQVFIVTRLPRASIDEFLAQNDAK